MFLKLKYITKICFFIAHTLPFLQNNAMDLFIRIPPVQVLPVTLYSALYTHYTHTVTPEQRRQVAPAATRATTQASSVLFWSQQRSDPSVQRESTLGCSCRREDNCKRGKLLIKLPPCFREGKFQTFSSRSPSSISVVLNKAGRIN